MKQLYCSVCQLKKDEKEFSSKEKKMMNKRKCTECAKQKNKKEKQDVRKEILEKIYNKGKQYIKPLEKSNDENEIKRREKERKKLTTDLTEKILKKNDYICVYCQEEAKTADHKKPIARGGETKEENLVAACGFCNNIKGNIEEIDFIKIKNLFSNQEWLDMKRKYIK